MESPTFHLLCWLKGDRPRPSWHSSSIPQKKSLGLIARMQWKERFEAIEIFKTITNRFFKDIFKKQIGIPTRSKNGNWPIQVFCGCQRMGCSFGRRVVGCSLCFDFNRWDAQRPRSTFMENPENPNQNSDRNWFLSWWILRSLPQVVQMFDWFFSLFVNYKLMKDDFFWWKCQNPEIGEVPSRHNEHLSSQPALLMIFVCLKWDMYLFPGGYIFGSP